MKKKMSKCDCFLSVELTKKEIQYIKTLRKNADIFNFLAALEEMSDSERAFGNTFGFKKTFYAKCQHCNNLIRLENFKEKDYKDSGISNVGLVYECPICHNVQLIKYTKIIQKWI